MKENPEKVHTARKEGDKPKTGTKLN